MSEAINEKAGIPASPSPSDCVEWTGFNFIDVHAFCPEAVQVLHHETIRIPDVLRLVRRGEKIGKKNNKYYICQESQHGK